VVWYGNLYRLVNSSMRWSYVLKPCDRNNQDMEGIDYLALVECVLSFHWFVEAALDAAVLGVHLAPGSWLTSTLVLPSRSEPRDSRRDVTQHICSTRPVTDLLIA